MKRLLIVLLLLTPGLAFGQDSGAIRYYASPSNLTSPTITSPTITGTVTNTGGLTFTAPVIFPDGSAAAPGITFDDNTGFYQATNGSISYVTGGNETLRFESSVLGMGFRSSALLWWGSSSTGVYSQRDLILSRDAAATLQLGADVNGSAVAQTIKAHDGITGTDVAGANLTVAAGRGTGAGSPGYLSFQTSTALTTGTTAQSLAERVRIQGPSFQGSSSKTLTDNTATAFVRVAVADDDYEGCNFVWTAYAEDADADARQTRTGRTSVAILNNGGTEVAVFSTGDEAVAVTAGTLACTFDAAAGTNTIDLRATCDTSLDAAAETLTFEYRLDCPSTTTVTPQ